MAELDGAVFDPQAELLISEEHWPHWAQAGSITFVTMRLEDSIPREVLERWERERLAFLRDLGIECGGSWRKGRELLSDQDRHRFDRRFERAREMLLDECRGQCQLRLPAARQILLDCLDRFDGERYKLGDLVIMPNHLHLLAVFGSAERTRKQCGLWERFSARKINAEVGRRGALWYPEPFDHLVRSESQLEYLRKYIAENPRKAGLDPGSYFYRRSDGIF